MVNRVEHIQKKTVSIQLKGGNYIAITCSKLTVACLEKQPSKDSESLSTAAAAAAAAV